MKSATRIEGAEMFTQSTPPIPTGRRTGQRFFRVGDREFHYLIDQPEHGYSSSRPEVWFRALSYASETAATMIEERTNDRLNDYVGAGVFGLSDNGTWGPWHVGDSVVVAIYEVN